MVFNFPARWRINELGNTAKREKAVAGLVRV